MLSSHVPLYLHAAVLLAQGPLSSSTSAPIQSNAQPLEQPHTSVPIERDTESEVLVRLRDRLKDAERKLKISQGLGDVWKSKAQKELEHEEFLLAEIKRAADDMLCKLLKLHQVFSSVLWRLILIRVFEV